MANPLSQPFGAYGYADFQTKILNPFGFGAVGSDAATYGDYIRKQLPVQKKRIEAGAVQLEM